MCRCAPFNQKTNPLIKEEKKNITKPSQEKVTAFILALIGLAFLATGLYLVLGGTGTLPAFTSGIGLLIGGAAFGIAGINRSLNIR